MGRAEKKLTTLKAKDDLPPWFKSKHYYQGLEEERWLDEIVMRLSVQTVLENTDDIPHAKELFDSLVVNENYTKGALASSLGDISDLWGVKEPSGFDALYLAAVISSSPQGSNLFSELNTFRQSQTPGKLFTELPETLKAQKRKSFGELIDWKSEPINPSEVISGFPLVVDLEQDDETLKIAFEVWLAGARAESGEAKNPYSTRDYATWRDYGVLQAFDLQFWARLNKARFTNNVISNAIWPLDEVDTTERLRKVTNPKIKEIFTDWTMARRLWRQVELSKALADLVAGTKNEETDSGNAM
ncbi:DUF6387 family protein [Thioalbus denitrificans]|uniref:Uncharacterized protein n=1 Tax=Thioalbus denitrificans TaxID=547122 RepID=A0A369CEP0_9GAMM|nr:DUF6387 family protein [Thioalbus denitrificans]RCX31037.1 hypothetical protein DFQ59_1031 [Thioalbus denitrificans]